MTPLEASSLALRDDLKEQRFTWMYFLKQDILTVDKIPVSERNWYIQRFAEQKNRENAAIEKAKKGKK